MIPKHREDLADLIIKKSQTTKQDSAWLVYFFINKPTEKILTLTILLSAFFFGFKSASTTFEEKQFSEQKSVIEEIYYPNSQIL